MNQMNDDIADIEDLTMPEGDDLDNLNGSVAPVKKGFSPLAKVAAIGAVGILVVGVASFSTLQTTDAPSRLSGVPNIDSTPGGAVQSDSPRYQERIEQSNDARSARAAELGVTFIPTSEAILEPIPDRAEPITIPEIAPVDPPEVEVEPVVRRIEIPEIPAAPVPVRADPVRVPIAPANNEPSAASRAGVPNSEEPENPFIASISKHMATTSKLQVTPNSAASTLTVVDRNPVAQTAPQSGADSVGMNVAASPQVILRPGDVLYGETLTSNNSDANAPVLVEVTTGDYKGARLVGTYSVPDGTDRMVVSFSSMTLVDGETLGISAFAVDGISAETAVASDVDRRLVQRYGPIFAATFLSTYAASVGNTQTTTLQDGSVVVSNDSTSKEAAYAGIGAAASVIAGDIASRAVKGPLVKLEDGFPLGILFVAPVSVEN